MVLEFAEKGSLHQHLTKEKENTLGDSLGYAKQGYSEMIFNKRNNNNKKDKKYINLKINVLPLNLM